MTVSVETAASEAQVSDMAGDYISSLIIVAHWEHLKKTGEYPKIGEPTCKCADCSFHNITCFPSPKYVGCLGGWNLEVKKDG